MRKKSKYKPKPVRADAVDWVLGGMKPFTSVSAGTDIRIKNHLAMDQLRRGVATKDDVDILRGVVNMLEGLGRMGIGDDWQEEIRAGQDALLAVARRGVQNNMRFVVTGPELKALNLAMEIHDAQLEACTVRQLEQAFDIVKEDILHKRTRAINAKDRTSPVSPVAETGNSK